MMRPVPLLLAVTLAAALAACADAPTDAPVDPIAAARLRELELRELARVDSVRAASTRRYELLVRAWTGFEELGLTGIVPCRPLPYEATVRIVGPRGATLAAGAHELVIPAGALARDTVITLEALVGTTARVELAPHGLAFPASAPPVLTLDYSECAMPARYEETVAYVEGDSTILEWPRVVDAHLLDGRASVALDHFSGYVVAYRGRR